MSKIYVMTHKIVEDIPNDGFYVPLHVGREGKSDLGYLADNTGDNISAKNANYCELTGIYWLWKNCTEDIVGICHYRRFFIWDEAIITQEKVDELMSEYDIIVPRSSKVRADNVYEYYAQKHFSKDLDMCRTVIAEKCPAYLDVFDAAMSIPYMNYANMIIAKKEIFDSYCNWLFEILFEVEKRTDISEYDSYQARIYGFLSERLMRVWLLKNNYRVYEIDKKEIDPVDFENAAKQIELKYNIIKLKHKQLVDLYANGVLYKETLIPEFSCQDDFEGKHPVWWCWWQGLDNMPEVVSLCLESLKRNLPENTALRIITFDNLFDYVTMSPSIIDKFNNGSITEETLSDVLCNELLYRYGGMWIDATYYVNAPVHEELFERDYFTLRYDKPIYASDITKGRYSGNLQITKPGNLLHKFVTECFLYYYDSEDAIVDNYQIDYCIAMAIELFEEVRDMVEKVPYSNGDILLLKDEMNHLLTDERKKRLKEVPYVKLSYRDDYRKQNIAGEDTLYNAIWVCAR